MKSNTFSMPSILFSVLFLSYSKKLFKMDLKNVLSHLKKNIFLQTEKLISNLSTLTTQSMHFFLLDFIVNFNFQLNLQHTTHYEMKSEIEANDCF